MAVDPRSVANYILRARKEFGLKTTQIDLQKILYFCHGSYLQKHKSPLVTGYFEAWTYGPVHPVIYQCFKSFRNKPITEKAKSTNVVTGEQTIVPYPEDRDVRLHVGEVVIQLSKLSTRQLVDKAHAPNGPWSLVVNKMKTSLASPARIPDNAILERFSRHILPISDRHEGQHEPDEDYPLTPD